MKQGTVDQVDESQDSKIRMVTPCNVVKLVLPVWLSHLILTLTPEEVEACIQNDQLLLACGKKVPLLTNPCVEPLIGVRSKMLFVKVRVGEKTVDVLRDTGCSGVVVKKDLVGEDQFTGDFNVMLLIDNTARKVPIARIHVDTPYLASPVTFVRRL